MRSDSPASDILIVGGGFAGAVAALTLANEKRHITVLESSAEVPRFSGDLIHPLGSRLLSDIGVLDRLLKLGAASIRGFAVFPGSGPNTGTRRTKANQFAILPYVGAPGLALDSRTLVQTLQAEANARTGVELQRGCSAVALMRRNGRVIGVRDTEGREWLARLTLVAQGRHARLRRELSCDAKPRVLSISTALTLNGVALPLPDYAHIFLDPGGRGGGPLLAHPLGEGQLRVSIDLPLSTDNGTTLPRRVLNGHIAKLPAGLAEALRAILQRDDAETLLFTRTTCAFQTVRCAEAGIALVGDAAGCTHPISGTGMTTALIDARILREELDRAEAMPGNSDTFLDRALVRYQERRYHFARPRELLAESLYDVFCAADGGARALRHGLFRYWNASPRARSVSLALLSGEISSLRTLAAEYLHVLAASICQILSERVPGSDANGNSLRGEASAVGAVLSKCGATLVRWSRRSVSLRRSRYDCPPVALSR